MKLITIIAAAKGSKMRTKALLVAACISVITVLSASPAVVALEGITNFEVSPQAGPYHLWFRHSSKCIAIPNNTTANVQLHQWSCFDTASELWYFDYAFTDSNGLHFYLIRSARSGKCLNISGNSLQNGAAVVQYPCGNYANEYFAPVRDRAGNVPAGFFWMLAYSSDKVLNIAGASTANGGKLIQYTACYCNNEYIAMY
jgi:hypothetical protein